MEGVPLGEADTLTHAPTDATGFGRVLGTIAYMAPEQARGIPVDQRADIFAFGVVLYEMLAGERPFRGETATDTVAAILKEEPPLLPESVPSALQGVVSQCLAKRPEQRFSSAHDLALALQATSSGPQTPATATVKVPVRVLRVRRSWLVGAAGVGLLAVVAALYLWKPWSKAVPAASFDPKSVVVAVFENRTSDASLDTVGQQISDALTNDLLKTGELKVAVNPVAAGWNGEVSGDPLLRLAQATRSALVVAGTYDLRGDQLEVQARVVEPWQGTVVYTAAPVRCPRGDPLSALDPLRQRLTGAVEWNFDRKLRAFFNGFPPPRYDALIAFRLGLADFGRDWGSALTHFEKAAALDPEFDLAQLMHLQLLEPEKEAKELAAVEANLGRMVPVESAMVRWLRADLDGRRLDALAAQREWASLSEFAANFRFDIAQTEIGLNRPAEAIRDLMSLPADWEALGQSFDYQPTATLASAYHMNRDYDGQLKVAREGERRFPGVLLFYAHEAGALAARGRLDEVEKVIEACEAQGGFRPSRPFGTPGDVIFTIAGELRAHGHREESLKTVERAIAWYRARPAAEAAKFLTGFMLMQALCQSERWAEAKAVADPLLAKNPDGINVRGWVGTLAARLGDVSQARRIEGELAAVTRPYLYGRQTYNRACIAAQLGEKDRSVALLRDAFAQGFAFDMEIHTDIDLEPLWGYPPYEELMKPKG